MTRRSGAALPSDKLTQSWFAERLGALCPDIESGDTVAVALSGGGDSMALTWLLSRWCARHKINLHALTVNHGLRAEATAEAKQVAGWVEGWGLTHRILKWTGPKPQTRIQEAAREARYRLLSAYCHKHKIRYLFLAHHADDQAETILFRLAKGSGLDGLSGMSALQLQDRLTLVRPLLDQSHDSLIKTCKAAKTPWVEDISNVSDRYARIRLRKSREILEAEGLSVKRILSIGVRMERARKAFDQLTDMAWESSIQISDSKQIVFIQSAIFDQPDEIALRLLQRALMQLNPKKTYPPRLESLEALVADLKSRPEFRAATLGGCVIRHHLKDKTISIRREQG